MPTVFAETAFRPVQIRFRICPVDQAALQGGSPHRELWPGDRRRPGGPCLARWGWQPVLMPLALGYSPCHRQQPDPTQPAVGRHEIMLMREGLVVACGQASVSRHASRCPMTFSSEISIYYRNDSDEEACLTVVDDPVSDRVRCDHPPEDVDGEWLADRMREQAEDSGRGRIVVLSSEPVAAGLLHAGFELEGRIPGFYSGQSDCWVVGDYPDGARGELAAPADVERVQQILACTGTRPRPDIGTRLATEDDAAAVAALLGECFAEYPTPSTRPDYIAAAITDGVPFRVVESDGGVVAVASADLVRSAATAEITDCATHPSARGRGLMRAIIADLLKDLQQMQYPTAFSLARATEPGINIALQRMGFVLQGTMSQSCRIGSGIEDMNIWSRNLPPRVEG